MSLFRYNTLDDKDAFRLILLRAGRPGDALFGEIFVRSLEDDVQYSALSYAWGSDEKSHILDTPDGLIPITESLRSALVRLRSPEKELWLWADAVCINQNDKEEKSLQVRLMQRIFENARQVHAYLGEEADNSELAYDLLQKLGTIDIAKAYGVGPEDTIFLQNFKGKELLILPNDEDESWEALRALLRRPWFRRAWVVQEVAVASDVIVNCGSWMLNWSVLVEALVQGARHNLPISADSNYDKKTLDATHKGHMCILQINMNKVRVEQDQKNDLIYLLNGFRNTLSTLARDHLFALLGLAADAEDESFDPNYIDPLELVVRKYGGALVRRGSGVQMLANAGFDPEPSRYPSWIPDWTKPPLRLESLGIETLGVSLYDAAKGTASNLSVSLDDSILKVRGGCFDTIAKVDGSRIEQPDSRSDDLISMIDHLNEADSMLADLSSYPTGEEVIDAYWRTLISNRRDAQHEAPDSFAKLYHRAREWLRRLTNEEKFDDGELFNVAFPYLRALGTFEFAKFCVTRKGYIGLGTKGIQQGDLVYVLFGMNVPYVLRRCDSRPDHFRIVGRSYIHGIMNGEACASNDFVAKDLFIW